MIRRLLFAALFMSAFAAVSPAHAGCADAPLTIRAPTLSTGDERALEVRFRKSLARICEWWEPAFAGSSHSKSKRTAASPWCWCRHGAAIVAASCSVAAWRQGVAAITHEIVHVLAPNANRFLAEGLAVYANDRFQEAPAYPNFGKDLKTEARGILDRADIAALEQVATPSRLQLDGLNSRDAHLVAGSFVGFLI